jgi:hypothetical protein
MFRQTGAEPAQACCVPHRVKRRFAFSPGSPPVSGLRLVLGFA